MGEVIQERNIRTSDFDRFPIFSLTIESGITPKTERYERGSLVTKTEDLFKVVKPNEFVTNPMNLRFGALGYNTQEYDISVSGYYDVFSIDGNNCSGFWNAYFKTQHVMNIFDNLATGSLVEKKRVKYSTLKKIYLPMPSTIEEKNKVSKFMIFTGHLITLHQSKSFAHIFKDIDNSTLYWEQRKLGEIVDVCSGRDYKHLLEGDIPVYGTGGYMISVNKALSYDRDAIGIGRKGTIDKPYILNAPFWTVDTLFYVIPRNKIALIFAFGIFQNIDWEKKDESTGVPSLSKSAINEIDVLIPKYEEQQVLGLFFNGLDHLITLHQLEPFQLIFKAIAYRIIDYAKSKPPRHTKY